LSLIRTRAIASTPTKQIESARGASEKSRLQVERMRAPTPASASNTTARWPLRRLSTPFSGSSTRARVKTAPWRPSAAGAEAAAAAASAAATPLAPPPCLASWCRTNGAFVHESVELAYSPDLTNRTLRTTSAVKAGDQLAVVPMRLCVSMTTAATAASSEADPSWGWQYRSAVALLHHALLKDENGASSPLLRQGYLPHLPGWGSSSASSSADANSANVPLPQVPLLWTDAELRELQGCLPAALPTANETQEDRRRRFAREFLMPVPEFRRALEREAASGGGGSVEATAERLLAWALAVVTSRSFGFSGGHAMVPLVDMADHRDPDQGPNAEVAALSDEGNDAAATATATAIVLKATRDLSAGDPITITYGQHGPADTLLSYGFVSSSAPSSPGPCFRIAWDGGALLLAAFDALVAEGGPGVSDARELPGWQRRALGALFARSEAEVVAGEPAAAAKEAAMTSKKSNKGGGFGGGSKAKAATTATTTTTTTSVRFGGDREHSVDARLVGAARLLALSKQDAGVAAALKELAGGGEQGLAALCAPPPTAGDFPVSAAHEAVAMRALSGYTALVYRRAFKTTIQQDEQLLKGLVAERASGAAAGAGATAPSNSSSSSLLPPTLGVAAARDKLERLELALRYRLATKRELEKVAQAVGARMKAALAACG
jgi:hypothetical protein